MGAPGAVVYGDAMIVSLLFSALMATQAPTWPPIDDPVAAVGGGDKDAAVIVGVSEYYKLPPIAGAADNARAWQNYLLRVRQVPSSKVSTLTDASATKERIMAAATDAANDVKAGGTLWFVFIGHGAPAPDGIDGLLIGADAQADVDSLAARGVSQSQLLKTLSAGKHANSVVVFDACFSGKSADGSADLVTGVMATVPVRRGINAPLTVLASSETFAGPLPGTARPAFSYVLLGALRGWGDVDNDRQVTVSEAFSFTKDTLQASLGSRQRLPSMSGAPSRLSLPARTSSPDIAALTSGRCPRGTAWDGNHCQSKAPVTCPPGSSWNGDACVSLCPAGSSWNGKACAASTVECPAGSTWNGSACVATKAHITGPVAAQRGDERAQSGAVVGPVATTPEVKEDRIHLPLADSPVLGPRSAVNTLVIFSDLQCPFCSRVDTSLRDWVEDPRLKGRLKVVFKHFPLSFHKDARAAAQAALAARAVGGDKAFWAMTEVLFQYQRQLDTTTFAMAAERIGLNVSAFNTAYRKVAGHTDEVIARDVALGHKVNVRGTPSIFVNGVALKTRSVEGVLVLVDSPR